MTPKILLTASDVCIALGIKKSLWYSQVSLGKAPQPVKIGSKSLWRSSDLKDWVNCGCPEQRISEKIKKERNARNREDIKNLTDIYVKNTLTKTTCLSSKDIPDELTDMKRELLKLRRLITGD